MKILKGSQEIKMFPMSAWKIISLCLMLFVTAFLLFFSLREYRDNSYLKIRDLEEVETKLGKPMYVYRTYPPQFGKSMITEEESKYGIIINAYLIRKMPPKFLIIKIEKNSAKILQSKIEGSWLNKKHQIEIKKRLKPFLTTFGILLFVAVIAVLVLSQLGSKVTSLSLMHTGQLDNTPPEPPSPLDTDPRFQLPLPTPTP